MSRPAVILRNTILQLGESKEMICIPYMMVSKKENVSCKDFIMSLPFYESFEHVDVISLLLTQKDIEKYGFNSDEVLVVCKHLK